MIVNAGAASYVGTAFFLGRLIELKAIHNPSVKWLVTLGFGLVPAYCFREWYRIERGHALLRELEV